MRPAAVRCSFLVCCWSGGADLPAFVTVLAGWLQWPSCDTRLPAIAALDYAQVDAELTELWRSLSTAEVDNGSFLHLPAFNLLNFAACNGKVYDCIRESFFNALHFSHIAMPWNCGNVMLPTCLRSFTL